MFQKIRNLIKRKSCESGRSMVEILGVLAVIGVLTIGGLAGYRYAMNKYRANEVVNEINMRYVVAKQQMTVGEALNMSEFPTTILGDYEINVYEPDDMEGVVALEISNVPVDVAKLLFSSGSTLWKLPLEYFDIKEAPGVVASSRYSYPSPVPKALACDPISGATIAAGFLIGGAVVVIVLYLSV